MVGYDPNIKEGVSNVEQGIAGAISGCMTRGILQPLDVVKIRFQLQVEPTSPTSSQAKYFAIHQAILRILREEGLYALWKGHVPAQLLSVSMGAAQFSTFEIISKRIWEDIPASRHESRLPIVHFVCGAAAGILATVVSFPFDLIRTRLIAQGEPKHYKSLTDAVRQIYVKDGMRGFYRGLSPTVIQVAPMSGAQFGFYSLISSTYNRLASVHGRPSVVESLVCGSLSGIAAKTLVYPLDLAKKRMQVQGFSDGRKGFGKAFHCGGMAECLALTVKREGARGLFKGWWPAIVKAASTTAVNFTAYEQTCRLLTEMHR